MVVTCLKTMVVPCLKTMVVPCLKTMVVSCLKTMVVPCSETMQMNHCTEFVPLGVKCQTKATQPLKLLLRDCTIEEGRRQKLRRRSSPLFKGQNLFNALPQQLFCLGRFGRIGLIQPFLPNRLTQNRQCGKELNKFCPPNRRVDLCLCFSLHPSSIDCTLISEASLNYFTLLGVKMFTFFTKLLL